MPRVLVIDDQAFVRHTISLLLKAREYEVIEADRGTVGFEHGADASQNGRGKNPESRNSGKKE